MQHPKENGYTYADYLTWNDDVRYELIEGVPYMMAPAPSPAHQEISVELIRQIANYLRGKKCKAFTAPFDIRLFADTTDDTVVQPDLSIICDPDKIDARGCQGPPDMIIEILSPATAQRDQITKLNLYRDAGVREYWIVFPDERGVQVYHLENGKYTAQGYTDADKISISILQDCTIDLSTVFPPLPEKDA